MYDSLRGILNTVGDRDLSCLERLTNAEMGEFIDDVSLMLTQEQVLQLLEGNPSEETLTLALEVAATSNSECIEEIFSDPNAFLTFFPSLSTFIPNLEDIRERLGPGPTLGLPVPPCAPETADKIDDLRCELLQKKGLSKEECREQLDNLKDQAEQDLKDLADLMQNGPFANMPPLIADPSEACPEEGLINPQSPLTDDYASDISSILFEAIENRHLQDLMGPINFFTGQGGVLNAVLSDTKGRPFKNHN